MASCRVCGRQVEVSDIHWTCPRQEWIEVML